MSLADKLAQEKMTPLQEQSMKARMEYENTLLKESLEQLAIQSEKSKDLWEKETKNLINQIEEKMKNLQTSNELVNQNLKNVSENLSKRLEKDLGTLITNSKKSFDDLNNDFSAQIRSILKDMSNSHLIHQDTLKTSQSEFKGFLKRFKYIVLGAVILVVVLELIQTYILIKG